jgi:colanic acid/amylovoran biosynthesis glycosyltransferase
VKPLAIAYLSGVYPRATDTFVRNEVLGLRALGHVVHTFSIRRAEEAQVTSALIAQERDTTVYIVSDHALAAVWEALRALLLGPDRFLRAAALAWKTRSPGLRALLWQAAYLVEAAFLARRMREAGVEHLHNHIGENSASVAMLASELSGIPYSLTIHGPYIFRAPERWALREKILRSAFTVCISEFTRSQCMVHTPFRHWDRLRVVRCGPDPAFLAQEPLPPGTAPRLLWVGRICEEKGVPVLVEAARLLADEGVGFELTLIGDGPLRGAVEEEIRSAGLAERIELTGWLSSEKIRERLAQSRALVAPSFAEGLPIVLMEALAMGRPVISTFVAGIPELVEPGHNGWLVPAGSVAALAEAMRETLAAPPERLAQLGREGRRAVLERHDPAASVAELARLMAETRPA